MKIISFNVNGIRAAIKKGLYDWIKKEDFDIICIQELKANKEQIPLVLFEDMGYNLEFNSAEKKGYSGVATFSKEKPSSVIKHESLDSNYKLEGRVLQTNFKSFNVVNCYFPSGSSGDLRQDVKMEFLEDYTPFFKKLGKVRKPSIICGDFNIAHTEIDIHNPKGAKNMSGFKPEERSWLSDFLSWGFVDCFRTIHPDETERYSWWSLRAGARKNNKGWRIDYITCSKKMQINIEDAEIFDKIVFSDHSPIYLSLKNIN